MTSINPSRSVIVFDLDDTLYSEFSYKVSGIKAVIQTIVRLYPEWTPEQLNTVIDFRKNDWLDRLCLYCGFNESEKQTLLWQYRLHKPDIVPYIAANDFCHLIKDFVATALITDGRSLTQRLKLEALGLYDCFDDILISEAYSSDKPDEKRFRHIENKYCAQAEQFIYIGDNIKKDFISPKRMGWLTIGLESSSDNIHIWDPLDFETEYHPDFWLKSLNRLTDLMIK